MDDDGLSLVILASNGAPGITVGIDCLVSSPIVTRSGSYTDIYVIGRRDK